LKNDSAYYPTKPFSDTHLSEKVKRTKKDFRRGSKTKDPWTNIRKKKVQTKGDVEPKEGIESKKEEKRTIKLRKKKENGKKRRESNQTDRNPSSSNRLTENKGWRQGFAIYKLSDRILKLWGPKRKND